MMDVWMTQNGIGGAQSDVRAFHEKFGCAIGTEGPKVPDDHVTSLRMNLVSEEYAELLTAWQAHDLAEIADAIGDLIYVLLGFAITYGIDMVPVWRAIQESNMAKVGGATRGDGKIMKPEGWVSPDIAGIIAAQIEAARATP